MDATLKTLLKITAALVIPGGMAILIISELFKASDRREFKNYVRKTYGEGSNYVDTFHY
jgi:hypothetical protein